MESLLNNFPEYLVKKFMDIPEPERANVLKESRLDSITKGYEPDEDDINAFEEAIRYKDSKISLVKLMLEGMIEDDINDRVEAQYMARDLMNKYPMSKVLEVYEKEYRQETD